MWKIVVILLLTALAILMARLAYDAPVTDTRAGAVSLQTSATAAPPLMYAGIRG